jgi:hypothetical protein
MTLLGAALLTTSAALAQRRPPRFTVPMQDEAFIHEHPIRAFPAEIDLGVVAPAGVAEGTFHLVNVGDRPEHVARHTVSCGCTTVEFEPSTLAPGRHMTLTVRIEAPKEPGAERTRKVTFFFDRQEPLEVSIRLRTSGA